MGKGIVKLGEGQWAVKDGNLLAVKESNSRFLNTEFTVTRGTRATYVGRDGLIKESNLQDTNLVLNGDFEELGGDLVDNGDFALGDNGDWDFGGDWTLANGTAEILTSTNSFLIQSVVPLTVKTYKVQYEVVSTNGSNFRFAGGNSCFGTVTLDSATVGVKTVYVQSNGTKSNIQFNQNAFRGSIDNVSVQKVDPNDRWTLGTGWRIEDGVLSLDGTQTSSSNSGQSFSVNAGSTYKLEVNATSVSSGFRFYDTNGVLDYSVDLGLNTYYVTPTSSTYNVLPLGLTGSTGSIDNISVQEVKTATPRIDFTNNTDGHLLLEPERTNLVPYSEDFSNSAWSKANASVVSNNYISPDGTLNANKIIDNSTNGVHRIQDGVVTNSTGNYTYSIFLKKGTLTTAYFQVFNSGTTSAANVDLENGTIASGGVGFNHKIEDYGNDWYRCSISFTSTNTATTVYLYTKQAAAYIGTGEYLYAWGAQLEQASYATSYIPTHGSTTTRAADVCSNAGTSQDFNSEEGVLFVEAALLIDDDSNKYIALADVSGANKVQIDFDYSSSRLQYVVAEGGYAQCNIKIPYTGTNMDKIAVKWKANDFAIWINGVEIATDTLGDAPIGLNTLKLSSPANSNYFEGKVKQLQVYKEALNGTRLTHLTGTLGTDFYESYAEMASALTYTIQ